MWDNSSASYVHLYMTPLPFMANAQCYPTPFEPPTNCFFFWKSFEVRILAGVSNCLQPVILVWKKHFAYSYYIWLTRTYVHIFILKHKCCKYRYVCIYLNVLLWCITINMYNMYIALTYLHIKCPNFMNELKTSFV